MFGIKPINESAILEGLEKHAKHMSAGADRTALNLAIWLIKRLMKEKS